MSVKIYAGEWAKRLIGAGSVELQLDGAALTAHEAAVKIGIPEDDIGMLEIGGVAVPDDYVLLDGDNMRVYPRIIGG